MARQSAWPLVGMALFLATSAAYPQETAGNRLSILQEGSGNTLTVDQAGATGSQVGGLLLGSDRTVTGQLVLDDMAQTRSVERNGRRVLEPVIVGATALSAAPDLGNGSQARQTGIGNTANVTLRDGGGFVGLLQDNLSGGAANNASIALRGDGTALVGQEGGGNQANLSVSGTGALGSILQRGSTNDATLTVNGDNASGSISQIGSGNNSTLAVTSANGASVSYTVQGSGITNFNPTQGVDVTTNAASVSITQTAIGAP